LALSLLVVCGTSDPATTVDESKYLMNMVNSFHPGRASYLEIPGMWHNLTVSPSRGNSCGDHGGPHPQFHPALLPAIEKWLSKHG
jgi:hypothetical protein